MRISSLFSSSLYIPVTPVAKVKSKDEEASSAKSNDTENSSNSSTNSDFKSYLDDPKVMAQILKLQGVDTKVRAHEAAHQAAGAGLSGGVSFGYTMGPDGKQYATSGEVPIDMSEENDPKATENKMQRVRAAALAPSDPSPQDLKVASNASVIAMKAKLEQAKQAQEDGRAKSSATVVDE